MRYRVDPKTGNRLSALGFGCMRFPRGISGRIDIEKAEKLVLSAIERGVNYFDTAYVYFGSEQALGEVFRRNPGIREKIFLATKLPHYQCETYQDFDKIFNAQLKRLNADYIDYYLIHNLTGESDWNRIKEMGADSWIARKKADGQIRRIGFSFHGARGDFTALLDAYEWDFCMIQYNYMNENHQAGREGLAKAAQKGIAVMVMEPLLGGKLAKGLSKKAAKIFKDAKAEYSPAAWALRWLWNQSEVTVVLSGMNAMEQLDENIATVDGIQAGDLTKEELSAIAAAVEAMREPYRIPCTECGYCVPCPKGVNIPGSFAAYNSSYASGLIPSISSYMTSTRAMVPGNNHSARNCVKCGACEKRCPQKIAVMDELSKVVKRMEPPWLMAGAALYRRLTR